MVTHCMRRYRSEKLRIRTLFKQCTSFSLKWVQENLLGSMTGLDRLILILNNLTAQEIDVLPGGRSSYDMVWYEFRNATNLWQVVAISMQIQPPLECLLITITLHVRNSTTGTDEEATRTTRDSIRVMGDDEPYYYKEHAFTYHMDN